MTEVINLRDFKLGRSMHRILKVWDQRSNDSSFSPQHRLIARKLAKTYREALEELSYLDQNKRTCNHNHVL